MPRRGLVEEDPDLMRQSLLDKPGGPKTLRAGTTCGLATQMQLLDYTH